MTAWPPTIKSLSLVLIFAFLPHRSNRAIGPIAAKVHCLQQCRRFTAGCRHTRTAASVEQRRHHILRLWLMFQHYARSSAKALLRRSRLRGVLLTITPVEAIHAPGSIDQLLLAGKKRMAGGTNFN